MSASNNQAAGSEDSVSANPFAPTTESLLPEGKKIEPNHTNNTWWSLVILPWAAFAACMNSMRLSQTLQGSNDGVGLLMAFLSLLLSMGFIAKGTTRSIRCVFSPGGKKSIFPLALGICGIICTLYYIPWNCWLIMQDYSDYGVRRSRGI